MQKKLITILILIACLFIFSSSQAQENLAKKLAGRILLQVESFGEAWYINPTDNKKYYLGRPSDAFDLIKKLATGITNIDLAKFPIGLVNYMDKDSDNDGLSNRLENALGTNPDNADSDNDGYDDKTEIINNYNPLGAKKFNIDYNLLENNLGKFFLQVENNGEAWYINPIDKKRYFLNRPTDAFTIMKNLGIGITNNNINKIITGPLYDPPNNPSNDPPNNPPINYGCSATDSPGQVIANAANAIRNNKSSDAITCFTPEMQAAIEYTMNFLDSEGRLTLGNILSGSSLSYSTNTEKTYSNEVYFSLGGYKVPVNFYIKKQENGSWLIINL